MYSRQPTVIPSRASTARPTSYHSRPKTGQSRPWTAQSRPTTGRPQTAASVRRDASYVVAILEGRGISREVGMAALDKDTGRVMLVQVCLRGLVTCCRIHCSFYRLPTARPMSRLYTRCICIILFSFSFQIPSCPRVRRQCYHRVKERRRHLF